LNALLATKAESQEVGLRIVLWKSKIFIFDETESELIFNTVAIDE